MELRRLALPPNIQGTDANSAAAVMHQSPSSPILAPIATKYVANIAKQKRL